MSRPKLTNPQIVAAILAIAHLSLVLCGASHFNPVAESHFVGKLVHLYSWISGANNSYGFFAPAVASHARARFVITDYHGNTINTLLERGSGEFNIRLHTMLNLFTAIEEAQDLLARSLSGWIFGKYPDAQKVTLIVEIYNLPTMSQFRSGINPVWEEYYTESYLRISDLEN